MRIKLKNGWELYAPGAVLTDNPDLPRHKGCLTQEIKLGKSMPNPDKMIKFKNCKNIRKV